jgi:cytochrome c oxidase assembly factor CtaG
MFNLLLANAESARFWSGDLWYALVAVVSVSLVYAATRHERMLPILIHAGRVFLWIVGFMLLVFVIMQFISART